MAETVEYDEQDMIAPDLSHLITEDDTPVDNRYSERQMPLLTSSLFESWEEGKPFEALTDVGLFSKPDNKSVVVPDFLLSLGVEPRPVTEDKESRSYFIWLYGQPPNLVIEIVSNKEGGELDRKYETYQKIGVAYYAVHDPFHKLGKRTLRLFRLEAGKYIECASANWMPEIGLGLTLWKGVFQDVEAEWLRFVDEEGHVIPTGGEKAQQEREKAQQEREKAQQERDRADRLAARLHELGEEMDEELS
ncbi:MAG: Uma2 family endonuclease [Vulcanimicrobiota bacterium]